MNNWLAALLGAAVMYVIACLVTIADEYWLDDKFCAPFSAVGIVVMFLPCMFWGLFRHLVKPVEVGPQNKDFISQLITDSKQVFPGVYFCHDKNAKRLPNKFFFFRLKKN